MTALADNNFAYDEVRKTFTPLFLRCKDTNDLLENEFEFYQSDFNNNGGFETLNDYIKYLCNIIINSQVINLNRIKVELYDLIEIDGIEKIELDIYNEIIHNLGFERI